MRVRASAIEARGRGLCAVAETGMPPEVLPALMLKIHTNTPYAVKTPSRMALPLMWDQGRRLVRMIRAAAIQPNLPAQAHGRLRDNTLYAVSRPPLGRAPACDGDAPRHRPVHPAERSASHDSSRRAALRSARSSDAGAAASTKPPSSAAIAATDSQPGASRQSTRL